MSTQWEPRLTLPVADDRDHVQGPADAAVTLLEYGDYECPFCGAAYPIVKQVQETMGERLRFVFRNFPITTRTRMPSRPPRPQRPPRLKGNSGRCTISSTRINGTWRRTI